MEVFSGLTADTDQTTNPQKDMFVEFEELGDSSKIWIYQADRFITTSEVKVIEETLTAFCGQWTALVAAIKQKHEISKDLFKMGQELGYIDKRVTEVKVESEFTFWKELPYRVILEKREEVSEEKEREC